MEGFTSRGSGDHSHQPVLCRLSPAWPGPLQNGPPSVLHPAPWAEGRGVAAPGADEGASEAGGGHTGLRDRGPLTERRQDGASRGAGWRVLLSGGGGKPGAFSAEAGTRWGTVAPGGCARRGLPCRAEVCRACSAGRDPCAASTRGDQERSPPHAAPAARSRPQSRPPRGPRLQPLPSLPQSAVHSAPECARAWP